MNSVNRSAEPRTSCKCKRDSSTDHGHHSDVSLPCTAPLDRKGATVRAVPPKVYFYIMALAQKKSEKAAKGA